MTRDKVFISYSHCDKRWMMRLKKMLRPLVRKGTISLWADTEIQAGASWRDEIERALASARVAVLLVSAEFLASDFIVEEELPPLLRAAAEEGVTILWVYLSPCHYEETPIGRYQAAHDVTDSLLELSFPKQQRALLEVSRQIKEAFSKALPEPTGSVALEKLSQRHEVLTLPDRGDGVARVLSLHLGLTTVIGRCYAGQLREAARSALEALGEDRVHWVLAWDDDRLNQILARLRCRTIWDEAWIEVHNLTSYSTRRQSLSVTAEAGVELTVEAGESVEQPLRPGRAITLTTGLGSGRQQLVRLVGESFSRGGARFPVLQTVASFLFPPTGGDHSTLIRYLGGWIPLGNRDLTSLLPEGAEPLLLRFPRDGLDLSIEFLGDRLRVSSNSLNLARTLSLDEKVGAPVAHLGD